MRVLKLTHDMHVVLAEHLSQEYATAKLNLRNGAALKLIAIDSFSEERISGADFGADPVAFDPAEVVDVELLTLDPVMLASSELEDLGLVSMATNASVIKAESGAVMALTGE